MKTKQNKVAGDKCAVIKDLPAACSSELLAVEFMEHHRWGDMPACAHCGSVNVYKMQSIDGTAREKHYRWRCRDCKQMYSVRTGTVFEDSRIPLKIWCHAFWRACTSKKGVSALQIKRETGLSYKSALFLMNRVRFAMTEDHAMPPKLGGVIEADETYVGGRPRYRKSKSQGGGIGKAADFEDRKTPVVAIVERGGRVRASAMTTVNGATITAHLVANALPSSRLMTDNARLYDRIGKPFASHERVNHSIGEYVRGDVHTNTIEGFFSLIKRGMIGTFHSVSRKHLHRYVGEFEFRYNTRKDGDGERVVKAIKSARGKRLTYKDQVR